MIRVPILSVVDRGFDPTSDKNYKIGISSFFTNINIQQLEAPRSLYSSPGYNNMYIKLDNFFTNINIQQLEALRSMYSSPGYNNMKIILV